MADGILDEREAVRILRQIAAGLAHAHDNGIIHRDIKSANIMLTTDGQVKITDFGLAKQADDTGITKTKTTMGTVAYMSPEQVRGDKLDSRTDIWSLGIIFYEMLTGRLPFQADREHEVLYSILHDSVPLSPIKKKRRIVKSILAGLLEKDKTRRYCTMHDLLFDLEVFLTKGSQKLKLNRSFEQQKTRACIIGGIFLGTAIGLWLIWYNALYIPSPAWMQPQTLHKRLTSSPDAELGRISPNGKNVIYHGTYGNIYKKSLQTGAEKILLQADTSQFIYRLPSWFTDNEIVVARWGADAGVVIIDSTGAVLERIIDPGIAFFPSCSPDGRWISYFNDKGAEASFFIYDRQSKEKKSFSVVTGVGHAWSPDSRFIAFANAQEGAVGSLKLLNIETGKTSTLYLEANAIARGWDRGGLAWSPDGRFLIYGALRGTHHELYALPLRAEKYSVRGNPIRLTHFRGEKRLSWPTVSNNGDLVSYNLQESNKDIYCVQLDRPRRALSGPILPIAVDLHVDTDPCWSRDGESIIFSSDRDGNFELYRYDFESAETTRLTFSEAEERFPALSPDGRLISYLDGLHIWALDGTKMPRRLSPLSLSVHQGYCWSPDGDGLVVSVRDTIDITKYNIHFFTLRDTIPHIRFENLDYPDFAFSPDASSFFVLGKKSAAARGRESGLFLVDLLRDQHTHLTWRDLLVPRGRLSWTFDSRFIIQDRIINRSRFVELVPADGSAAIPLRWEIDFSSRNTTIDMASPVDDRVLIIHTTERADVWAIGLE